MSKKLTFGDLHLGDKFIGFPSDGNNQGHGGFLQSHNVFMKIEPCYTKSIFENFKTEITKHSALKMNAVSYQYGTLAHLPNNMFVIKIN